MKKIIIAVLCVILSLTTVGGTVAYLRSSASKTNEFDPGRVSCEVVGSNAQGATIKNTGNTKAYIRAAYTVNYVYETNERMNYCMEAPSTTTVTYRNGITRDPDYSIVLNTTNWLKGVDGYYYYKTPVAAGASTAALITTFNRLHPTFTWEGVTYTLTVDIACEAIQCEEDMMNDTPAVEQAWKVTLAGAAGSNIVSVPSADYDPYP